MLLMLSGCAFSNGSETTTSCSHEGEEDDGTAEQQDVGRFHGTAEEQDDGTAEQQEDEGEEDDGTAEFTDVQNT